MPLYHVTCRELVYVDRTYEVAADDENDAKAKARELSADMIDEVMGDGYEFCRVLHVDPAE